MNSKFPSKFYPPWPIKIAMICLRMMIWDESQTIAHKRCSTPKLNPPNPNQILLLGLPKRGSHPLHGGSKLLWHPSGSCTSKLHIWVRAWWFPDLAWGKRAIVSMWVTVFIFIWTSMPAEKWIHWIFAKRICQKRLEILLFHFIFRDNGYKMKKKS